MVEPAARKDVKLRRIKDPQFDEVMDALCEYASQYYQPPVILLASMIAQITWRLECVQLDHLEAELASPARPEWFGYAISLLDRHGPFCPSGLEPATLTLCRNKKLDYSKPPSLLGICEYALPKRRRRA